MPILPSHQEQLNRIREDAEYTFVHIDTCLPSFLNDHHNREGELLLGVYVDGKTTIGDVFNALETEFNAVAWQLGETKSQYDHDKARNALRIARESNVDRLDTLFDASLEIPDLDDCCDESVVAYFLIVWTPDEA